MVLPIKVLLGVAGVSAISVGAVGVYLTLQPSTIEEELIKEGKKLVPENDSESWKTLSDNHYKVEVKEASGSGKPLAIKDLDLKNNSDNKEDKLKGKCHELLETPLSSEDKEDLNRKKQEARDWCVLEGAGFKVKG